MSNDWEQGYSSTEGRPNQGSSRPNPEGGRPDQEEIDKRIEEIRRSVSQGANEVQQRVKRVVDRASTYWQQTQTTPTPRQSSDVEEQRLRQLVNIWGAGNWRVAKDLGTYMEIVAIRSDELWDIAVQTRWEARALEIVTEPYAGRQVGKPQPMLPIWDYELGEVNGLKPPTTRTGVEGLDEILSCTSCNGTGRALCTECTGRGWVTCPDCKGRTKKRCATCRGRGYISDWADQKKKPFMQRRAEDLASSVGSKVSDVFEGIRQQGVPLPNPMDSDPANKGRTIPCPDCVNGEVDCDCVTGKRVCPTCQGGKMGLCVACNGTGKVVRRREMVRSFDLRSQSRVVGLDAIPEPYLQRADGELIYSAEINEELHADVAPDRVPQDVWRSAVDLVEAAGTRGGATVSKAYTEPRATLQVLELVRVPYTKIDYRYADSDYALYIYDCEGHEKFYAERFPARWDRVERLVRAITSDLMAPPATEPTTTNQPPRGYRVPVEKPPYSITEDDDRQ